VHKYSHVHFHRPALLPKTEQVRGNRNPPLLMVKPIKRYEEEDRVQNFRSDTKVWLSYDYYNQKHIPGFRISVNFDDFEDSVSSLSNASDSWAVCTLFSPAVSQWRALFCFHCVVIWWHKPDQQPM
jgi:hypothetical protein